MKAREAELQARIQELEQGGAALHADITRQRDEALKERDSAAQERQKFYGESERWREHSQRLETVMQQRIGDARRDVDRYVREINFLRDALYRVATGSQLEQTFTVVGGASANGASVNNEVR